MSPNRTKPASLRRCIHRTKRVKRKRTPYPKKENI